MRIESLVVGALEVNCFIITDGSSADAAIVDPGGDADAIIARVETMAAEPRLIVNTHCHGDHIAANQALKRSWPDASLVAHALDAPALTDPQSNLSFLLGFSIVSPPADRVVEEGDEIQVGSLTFRVIHTPGHTPGGMCLLADEEPPVLLSGDTLFAGSVGRYDFPGGDHRALIESIRTKLLALPDETRVFTGHGPPTSIGEERRHNPFL